MNKRKLQVKLDADIEVGLYTIGYPGIGIRGPIQASIKHNVDEATILAITPIYFQILEKILLSMNKEQVESFVGATRMLLESGIEDMEEKFCEKN